MTQSAPTATLIARIPIDFFLMARSPLEVLKSLVWRRVRPLHGPHLIYIYNYCVRREFLDVVHCLSAIGALRRSKIALRC